MMKEELFRCDLEKTGKQLGVVWFPDSIEQRLFLISTRSAMISVRGFRRICGRRRRIKVGSEADEASDVVALSERNGQDIRITVSTMSTIRLTRSVFPPPPSASARMAAYRTKLKQS